MKMTRPAALVLSMTAALTLTACGGGDDEPATEQPSGPSVEEMQAQQISDLQSQIDMLAQQLGISEDADIGSSITDLQEERDRLQKMVDAQKEKDDMEADADMSARLNELAKAIGAVGGATSAGLNAEIPMKSPKATDGDAPHAISGWNGASYSHVAAGDTTTTVVYDNMEAPTSVAFSKKWGSPAGDGTYTFNDTTHGKYVGLTGLPTNPNHQGVSVGPVGVRGTFDGVPGVFESADVIMVGIDAEGMIEWGTVGVNDDIKFTPDDDMAMVMQKDQDYMALGYWMTKNEDGEVETVMVAADGKGGDAAYNTSTLNALLGTATFEGIAVGKYTHKTVNDITGGHFNADAELVADFDNADDAGTLTGTISNFMQDGESIGEGWKVELGGSASANGDDGMFDPKVGADIAGSIANIADGAQGTFGNQKTSGAWQAMFVGNSRKDKMPGGVTGEFHIGQASHPVNMTGSFAAANQEADGDPK